MYEFIYEFIVANTYESIFVLMAIFATEAVMPIVGYAASFGHVSLPLAIIAGTAGSTLGSVFVYAIARLFHPESVTAFMRKYGRWIGVKGKSIDRAARWFDRHAKATVFAGKLVPGVRTAVSLSAGFRRMPFLSYLGYTALGTGISSTLLAVIGYNVKGGITELAQIASDLSILLFLLFVSVVLLLLLWRRHR